MAEVKAEPSPMVSIVFSTAEYNGRSTNATTGVPNLAAITEITDSVITSIG